MCSGPHWDRCWDCPASWCNQQVPTSTAECGPTAGRSGERHGRATQAYSSLKRSKKQNKSHTHRPVALGVIMSAEYPSTRRGPSEYPSTRGGSSEYPSTHAGPSRVRQKQSIGKVRGSGRKLLTQRVGSPGTQPSFWTQSRCWSSRPRRSTGTVRLPEAALAPRRW